MRIIFLRHPCPNDQAAAQLQFQAHLTTGGFVKDITYPGGDAALPPLLTTTRENVAFGKMTVPAAVDDFFTQANAILNK